MTAPRQRLVEYARLVVSYPIGSRNAFLAVMGVVTVFKVWFCSAVPASFELRDMIVGYLPSVTNSPWVVLLGKIFDLWRVVTFTPGSEAILSSSVASFNAQLLLILLRLPPLLTDLAISAGVYLAGSILTGSPRDARLCALVWFLNPYNFVAAELLGVPDATAALFTVLSVLLLLRKRTVYASIPLGIAIALKLYAILLVPPILIYASRTLKVKTRNVVLFTLTCVMGVAGYLTWLYPFSLATFYTNYSPDTQPLNLMLVLFQPEGLGLGYISLGLAALVILFFVIWTLLDEPNLISTIIVVLLAYYLFSDPHPQYFIWVVPFLTLDVLLNRQRLLFFVSLVVLTLSSWFFNSGSFLTPSGYSLIVPQLYLGFADSYGRYATSTLLVPILRAGLYASILIYLLDIVLRDWLKLHATPTKLVSGDQA